MACLQHKKSLKTKLHKKTAGQPNCQSCLEDTPNLPTSLSPKRRLPQPLTDDPDTLQMLDETDPKWVTAWKKPFTSTKLKE